jgi:hypothetical protein
MVLTHSCVLIYMPRIAASKKTVKTGKKTTPRGTSRRRDPEPKLLLGVRPIPKPLHGVNLRSSLGDYRWRKLRRSLLDDAARQCDLCGKLVENSSKLNGHEEWYFDITTKPPSARVVEIKFVCWHCHASEHFPHTVLMVQEGILGKQAIEDTIDHFCAVNRTTRAAFARHLKSAMKEWERLSKYDFQADFGEYGRLLQH